MPGRGSVQGGGASEAGVRLGLQNRWGLAKASARRVRFPCASAVIRGLHAQGKVRSTPGESSRNPTDWQTSGKKRRRSRSWEGALRFRPRRSERRLSRRYERKSGPRRSCRRRRRGLSHGNWSGMPQWQGWFRPGFMTTGSLIYPLPRQIPTDSGRHRHFGAGRRPRHCHPGVASWVALPNAGPKARMAYFLTTPKRAHVLCPTDGTMLDLVSWPTLSSSLAGA